MSFPYQAVFAETEATLLSYGSRHRPIEAIQAELAAFRNLPASHSDDELFSKIMFVVFYSGFRAATVTKKADVIRGHFPDYQTVAGYGEADVRRIMSDHRMIKNERKIRAVIENARSVQQIVRDHGTFQSFIDGFHPMVSFDATMALKRELQKRFSYLGGITAYHFLTDIGMPVLKPDRVICRIFHRLGLINDETDTHEAVRQGRRFSEETGQPIRYIDIIFVAYGQASSPEFGIDKGICLSTPRCGECRIQVYCNYHRTTED